MKELIKIEKSEKGEVVSARVLYEYLEIKKAFTSWFKQMVKYGFEEGKDFIPFQEESIGGRKKQNFVLTLDTAKEISMIQRSQKGKEAREYFIKCEKIARQYDSLTNVEKDGIKRVNQVEGTFGVRQYLVDTYGKSKGVQYFIWWSKESHKEITGRTTKETKKLGKSLGLKSKDRVSAKEVVRTIEPANAFGLYVSDLAVVGGAGSNLAINIGKAAAKSIVSKAPMIETNKENKPF